MSKKRSRPLGEVIRMGLVEDGALLRYVVKDQLMAVGRARQNGIEVPGSGVMSAGRFEEHAGSKLHRPNQHTLASSGKSLQDIMADSFTDDTPGAPQFAAASAPVRAVPLLDDPNDDFCRVCGFGGDMLCCETCPATFHKECIGLETTPEGDWWCPLCVCAVCGQAHFDMQALPAKAKRVIWVDAKETSSPGPGSLHTRPLLLPPKLSPPSPAAPAADPAGAHIPVADATAAAVPVPAAPYASAAMLPSAATAAVTASSTPATMPAAATAATAAVTHAAPSAAHTLTLGGTDNSHAAANASQRNNVSEHANAGQAAVSSSTGMLQAPSVSNKASVLPLQVPELPISSAPKGRDAVNLPFDAPTLTTSSVAIGSPPGAKHKQLPNARPASDAQLACHTQQAEWPMQAQHARQAEQAQQAEWPMQAQHARQAEQAQQAEQTEQAQQEDQLPGDTVRMQQQAIVESSRHLIGVLGTGSPSSNQASGSSLTDVQQDSQTPAPLVAAGLLSAGQQKKRKAVEAAEAAQPSSTEQAAQPASKKKRSTGEGARLGPGPSETAGSPKAAADPADNIQERLQRLAATAPNLGAVHEAVALAFPPSQGSAKRAEKFKQFFVDVMPPGTKLKERQSALAAVSSHLWQGRDRAGASSPRPAAPGRATPNSRKPEVPALPSSPGPSANTLTAAAVHAAPKEYSKVTEGMRGSEAAAEQGKDKAVKQQPLQKQGPISEQEPPSVERSNQKGTFKIQQGRPQKQEGRSEGQEGSSEQAHVSEREARAAARLSRLARNSTTTGNRTPGKSKAERDTQPKGKSGQGSKVQQRPQIPQSDGPASDDSGPGEEESKSDVKGMAAAQKHGHPSAAVGGLPTAAAPPAPGLAPLGFPALGSAPLGFAQTLAAAEPQPALTSPGRPTALEQMAARYLSSSSATTSSPSMPPVQAPQWSSATAVAAAAGQQAHANRHAEHDSSCGSMPQQQLGLAPQQAQHAHQAQHAQYAQQADGSSPAERPAVLSQQQQHKFQQQQQHYALQEQQQQQHHQMPQQQHLLEVLQQDLQRQQQQQKQQQQQQQVADGHGEEEGCEQMMSAQAKVVCACSGAKYHLACLPEPDQAQMVSEEDVWFSSPSHRQVSAKLAAVCSAGVMPCEQAVPVTWQLIRGAAVADPGGCQGYAPRYSTSQKGLLRQAMFAARHILLDCFGKLEDSRTGQDLIPWMLQGRVTRNGVLDFSGMHLALLSVAGIITSVALVRAFGPEMAEVPLLATRHELQGNALGPALLHSIEEALQQAGVKAVIMPALPLSNGHSPEAPLAPEHTTATAVGPKPWGITMGYKMALPAQLLEACKMPMVQLPGTCYLIKQLSRQSLTQVKPLTKGLRLNPEADAEALAHAGLLIPLAPQAMPKAEAQPATTATPATAEQSMPPQAAIHTLPSLAPIVAEPAAPRQLQSLAQLPVSPPPAPAVAGRLTQDNPSSCLLPTAVLLAPSTATAAAAAAACVERVLAHSGATASASSGNEETHQMADADQHQPTGGAAAADPPGFANSKQAGGGLSERAAVSARALGLPSNAASEGMSETMAPAEQDGAGTSGMAGDDRQAKRQKLAMPEADLSCGQNVLNEMDHHESVGVVQGQDSHLSQSPLHGAGDNAESLSPRLMTKNGAPSTAAHIKSGTQSTGVQVTVRGSTEPT